MAIHLPSRAVILEIAKRQQKWFASSELQMDEKKLGAALAWARLTAKTDQRADIFDIVASLMNGIITERPLPVGNTHLAFSLLLITLRRNGFSLDISNAEAFQLLSKLKDTEVSEASLSELLKNRSIPQNFQQLSA